MLALELSTSLILCAFPLLFFLFVNSITGFLTRPSSHSLQSVRGMLPRSYPLIGSCLALAANFGRRVQWEADILKNSPSSTFVYEGAFGHRLVYTADPSNVHHILKSHFHLYEKGDFFRAALSDFLGSGIFNADGDSWKFQRKVSSYEFSTKFLEKFAEQVLDGEVSDRLIPILSAAARDGTVLDLQDVLQRFGFDNICKIGFGYDPECLSPSMPHEKFVKAFNDATMLSGLRIHSISPLVWRFKRLFDIGSERRLRIAIAEVVGFAKKLVREKKEELGRNDSLDSADLLSRFLSSGLSDENFVTDIVISFIVAGSDTTSAALSWFFWLMFKNPRAEENILKEICGEKPDSLENSEPAAFRLPKDMEYTRAALCETMRLYPPVPMDPREAMADDVLPTGTALKKGTLVTYHTYAMGRSEALWGADWPDFRPERWLEKGGGEEEKRRFVARDPYEYPVFHAGPRVCLGKEMAFLQMKRVVADVMRRFRIVPVAEEGFEPVLVSYLNSKMEGGFPVRVQERAMI